jgi:archaemetzincin
MAVFCLLLFLGMFAPLAANTVSGAVASTRDFSRTPQRSTPIAIQPFGDVDPALIRSVSSHIESVFRADVIELPSRPLPAAAYYRPRNRYRGERVLADLEARTPSRLSKVLGIMSRDLSVSKHDVYDWGVLGVAGLSCRAAVVSTHRLRRKAAPRRLVEKRLAQVATHELGHTFGLPHCPSSGCIMNDASGTIRTVDRSSGWFCISCARHLGRLLRDPRA